METLQVLLSVAVSEDAAETRHEKRGVIGSVLTNPASYLAVEVCGFQLYLDYYPVTSFVDLGHTVIHHHFKC